ncbi:hypothetical protein ACTMTF_38010 [Nonomuraea sp. ZG12]|uniref:hypothetical protein n=1 Tax=Nonomuraea sp. ZG12 TaxID=3452207 RepID=UPI003F8B4B8A
MQRVSVEGAAHLVLADGVVPLHPQDAVFAAMLTGWERLPAASTIKTRVDLVRRFAAFTGTPCRLRIINSGKAGSR